MGIKLKDLFEFSTLSYHALQGKRIAIDGPNMLFQILFNPGQRLHKENENKFYIDGSQRIINHLYGWLHKIRNCYKYRITPIVVFDGRPDALKREVSSDLAKEFLEMKQKYEAAMKRHDLATAKIFAASRSFMWINCVHESKELLEALGVPVIMAPSEAEAQCVALQQAGIVDYVVSSDFDVALFGATQVIRYLTFTPKELKIGFKCYNVQDNLARLGLNIFELIDLSLLLGNDYYPGIKSIGPKTALKTIQYYKSIEKIRAAHPELVCELLQPVIDKIRALFLMPEVRTLANIEPKWIQPDHVLHMLCNDHTLNVDRVNSQLKSLMYYAQKCYPRLSPSVVRSKKAFPNIAEISNIAEMTEMSKPSKMYNMSEMPKISNLSHHIDTGGFVCAINVNNHPRPDHLDYHNLNKTARISSKILQIDANYHINGFRRIEVWAEKDDLKVFYLDKDTPLEAWPDLVQVQFYIIMEILLALGLIPKKIFQAKYAKRMDYIANRCHELICLLEEMASY